MWLIWAQRGLFACAVLFLGYFGFAVGDAWLFQRRESADLDRLLSNQRAVGAVSDSPVLATRQKGAPATVTAGLIGRIVIPRLLLSVVVAEGIDKSTLRRVVGHIPGTALPGQPGNVGLAGHRDTYFRPLMNLKIKDEIELSTLNGDFRYVVDSLVVVNPDNLGVLASSSENVLTLVTCYPFYYIGAAPKRFIVRARQVSPPTVAAASGVK